MSMLLLIASQLLVLILLGSKYDKRFRHVSPFWGPRTGIIAALTRATTYAMLIGCGDKRMMKKENGFCEMYNGYQFRKHASKLDKAISYLYLFSGAIAFTTISLMLILAVVFHFKMKPVI